MILSLCRGNYLKNGIVSSFVPCSFFFWRLRLLREHEPAVPVWLDSFVCFGLARVAEHVVAFHVHLSMPIGYDLMHRRWAGMKKASALKMVLIGAETGLGNLVTNDDVSLLAENFQLVYGYPVHDPGGMIDSELTGFVGMR